jgi:hypothetical protein
MSRTLFTTIGLSETRIPLFQSFKRAVHTTSRHKERKISPRHQLDIKQQLTAYLQHQHRHQPHPTLNPNMSFLVPGLRRGIMLSTPLILSTPLLMQQYRFRQPIYCDGPDPITKITNDLTRNYASEAKTPVITESGAANPRAIRQVSMGSILGVFCGLGISVFSKPLAILIGLGIFVLQVRLTKDGGKHCSL